MTIEIEVFPFIITPLGVWQVGEEETLEPLRCAVAEMDPQECAGHLVMETLGITPLLVHGTSWRYDAGSTLILSFAAVLPRGVNVFHLHAHACVCGRTRARGGPTTAPKEVQLEQVRDHALRHLAFLVQTDPSVEAVLTSISSVLAWEPDVARFFAHQHRIAA